jgi:hypothetical protein
MILAKVDCLIKTLLEILAKLAQCKQVNGRVSAKVA